MAGLPVPLESEEGRTLVAYLRLKKYRFTHLANETGSGKGARFQGIRNKQQGVSRGAPDYMIIIDGVLIFIELKRLRGSSTSIEQREWIAALEAIGVPARICKGAKASIEFIEEISNRG